MKPILCLDFDGVIHAYTSGWQGETVIPDGPVPGALQFLADTCQHFDVVIYSSRSKTAEGCEAMRNAIREWFEAEGVYRSMPLPLGFAHEKPAAFLTIDDRAICFTGVFPPVDELLAFKPWNKKEGGHAGDVRQRQ